MERPTQEAINQAFSSLRQSLSGIEGVQSSAFFGFSPVASKAEEPDLDIVVVANASADQAKVDEALQHAASESGLLVDAWILGPDDLLSRMQRIAAKRQQPAPQESPEGWNGPAFITVFGQEVLAGIIAQANASPVNEAPIPPDPSSKKMFRP